MGMGVDGGKGWLTARSRGREIRVLGGWGVDAQHLARSFPVYALQDKTDMGGCGLGSRCRSSERWRDAAAPSGMRCHTSQLFAGSARRLSLFPLDLQHVCEQHLLRLASYASPCVGLRV